MTSTLLAVATPMHMIAPVNAGTDSVVPVANKIPSAAGSAMMMTKGSVHDLKIHFRPMRVR